MNSEKHPLVTHLKSTNESLTAFARRTGMSRMQLYRIMNGENTTLDTLKKISAATEGKITANDFATRRVQQ
ncbi:helix-turn-helix transcriptional regulator [Sinorhizobium meliloti]|uniref:helix-turn-helix domain-containing protein n=1 Tax=Rhizobium meliloti TaxID=382 RepID=UPI000B4A0387|nr:helix-turn-helix transcriptional regulator [Sinorhizobium meliloti]ASQ10202.1 XRE family transcriptional regulator [Sinorhizobium meliloti]MDX0227155.1 helix-turn-helix domain-containing protein [Sinorhizobium meliloti]MQU85671.1 helix-turn-helix domain-containing protein [Sinorhizobium meliloti]